jgi:hypothetical protein
MMDESRFRRIIFHIGLERTGTTSLQNYCFKNRRKLAEYSVLYPTKNYGFQRNNHSGLVASYLPPEQSDYFVPATPSQRPQVLDSLLREIGASSARTVILSSEHFSSRFRQREICQLSSDFKGLDVKIVMFFRDHLSRFYSTYATHVAGGGHTTVEQYCDLLLQTSSMELRYADMVALWERAFGRQNLEVRRFKKGKNVLAEFFGAQGVAPLNAEFLAATKTEWLDPLGSRTNRSLGPRRTEALRRANVAASRLLGASTAFD